MKFLTFLLGAAAAGSALAAPALEAPTDTAKDKRASKFKFVGVNQSGAEFGNKDLPGVLGKAYTWPVKSSIDVSLDTLSLLEWEKLMMWRRRLSARG